jgi:hypothetical protein
MHPVETPDPRYTFPLQAPPRVLEEGFRPPHRLERHIFSIIKADHEGIEAGQVW